MRLANIKLPPLYLILFALGILIKPFYFLPSGNIQIADICTLLSFISLTVNIKCFRITHKDVPLLVFLAAVIVINTCYYLIYQYNSFIVHCLYLIFNYLVILILREDHEKPMMDCLSVCCMVNIVVQFTIYLSGMGRWYGAYRFQGTFNDPNQLAFALFSWYLIIYCVNIKKQELYTYVFYLLALFLIFQSGSMGMMVGMLSVLIVDLLFSASKAESKVKRNTYMIVSLLLLIGIAILLISVYTDWSSGALQSIEMFRRLTRKMSRSDSGGLANFIRDRNLDNLISHPEVVLYGSGGGHMERFSADGDTREMHSTWIALLFYYGIIPFCFLLVWIKRNLSHMQKVFYAPIIAMVIESFTLVNFRQPTFWILFVLVGYCSEVSTDEIAIGSTSHATEKG